MTHHISDADVTKYVEYVVGHPDGEVTQPLRAVVLAILQALANDGRLTAPPSQEYRETVEGHIFNIMTTYGGARLVAGETMTKFLRDLVNEIYQLRQDGLL